MIRLKKTGVSVALIVFAGLVSAPASAERFFGEEIAAKSNTADFDLAVEAQFRSQDAGDRLLAEVGGITKDGPLIKAGSCAPDAADPEVAEVCQLHRNLKVIFRAKANGTKQKAVLRTREVAFLTEPELPASASVAAIPDCTIVAGGDTVFDETCAAFEPVADFCLHVGAGGGAGVRLRPVPAALSQAILNNRKSARVVLITRAKDGSNTRIKSVNKLTPDHPPLNAAELEPTIANANNVHGEDGAAACQALHDLVADNPMTAAAEAALLAEEDD